MSVRKLFVRDENIYEVKFILVMRRISDFGLTFNFLIVSATNPPFFDQLPYVPTAVTADAAKSNRANAILGRVNSNAPIPSQPTS
jgi:hypothetical protein